MEIPAYVAEMMTPANRPKLWFGIWSGFAIAGAFGLLAGAATLLELTPWRWAFLVLVCIKLATNTVALVARVWPPGLGPRARAWAGGPVRSNRFE